MTQHADTIIKNTLVVTMNGRREVIRDGAVVIVADRIAAVGKTAEVAGAWSSNDNIDGRRFVVVPGLVNTHIHITGEPLTRGYVPDNTPFVENVFEWLVPLYSVHTPEDERLSAQLASVEMLKSGTTTFLEAGTVQFVDEVVDGLVEAGIRGRIGKWVWDLPPEPYRYRQTTDQAIANLQRTLEDYGHVAEDRIRAWSIVVGHTTCSDPLWKAAKELADQYQTGMNFHMSPAPTDPAGFLQEFGHRPMVHLAKLDVLDSNVCMTHCVYVDDEEVALIAEHGANVSHCPTTALKVAYGVTQVGKFPEMVEQGINVSIGIDGNNASNYSDMYRATYLVAGLFKDARRDPDMFPAERAFEMATLGGARSMGMEDEIASIEVGKKADIVLHDIDRPEWQPLLNVVNQLVWSVDGRSVHTVFVDGRKVVDHYRCTTIDEERLYAAVQAAGEQIAVRSGLPNKMPWPLI
jgi:cytosine/adenosine deaminase-related metal-dependent hydrolase